MQSLASAGCHAMVDPEITTVLSNVISSERETYAEGETAWSAKRMEKNSYSINAYIQIYCKKIVDEN